MKKIDVFGNLLMVISLYYFCLGSDSKKNDNLSWYNWFWNKNLPKKISIYN